MSKNFKEVGRWWNDSSIELIEKDGIKECEEGCLSVPGFFEKVTRAEHIKVKALNRDGLVFERLFFIFRNLFCHSSSRCTLAPGKREYMNFTKIAFFSKFFSCRKIFRSLSRKSYNNIRSNGYTWNF